MKKKTLTIKFTLMFAGFTLLLIIAATLLSYFHQTQIYRQQREESIQSVSSYLEDIITSDGDDFAWYQEYFLSHYKELLVPHDFGASDVHAARMAFESMFAEAYPGKALGIDVTFEELSEDLKIAWTVYNHEYYLYKFERAREIFGLIYVEYIVPSSSSLEVTYVLDSMRDENIVDGKKYIELGITVSHPVEDHKKEWEAWTTGKRPSGYDTFDNEYGKTYAYYSPLFIKGKKLGLIGVEVEIAKVNHEILEATIQQIFMIGGVLIVFVYILLQIIQSNYINKLVKLQDAIEDYSSTKNPEIAKRIVGEVNNEDEISLIMLKFSDMIFELETYMKNLSKTRQDLKETQRRAVELGHLAVKDPLTGVRNKAGYDKEVQKIEWEIEGGLKNLGVAMIDLNFLKRTNDTYGHDKGNIALVTLCKVICRVFEHSPVFRVGGDEFVVILKGRDLSNVEKLVSEFSESLDSLQGEASLEPWERPSAAIGYAIFDFEVDSGYEALFERADKEMYTNKKIMKAAREL